LQEIPSTNAVGADDVFDEEAARREFQEALAGARKLIQESKSQQENITAPAAGAGMFGALKSSFQLAAPPDSTTSCQTEWSPVTPVRWSYFETLVAQRGL